MSTRLIAHARAAAGATPERVEFSTRTGHDIAAIRRAAQLASSVVARLCLACTAGTRTIELDRLAERLLHEAGAEPLFLGYRQGKSPPFPARVCVTLNEEVIHGVPSARRIAPGDLVSLDLGLRLHGWCADVARSLIVPHEHPEWLSEPQRAALAASLALVHAVRESLEIAAKLARPGIPWSGVAEAMECYAAQAGYRVVRGYVGHGIGRELHEWPKAPAYRTGYDGEDFELREGMVLAIEPILAGPPPQGGMAPTGPREAAIRLTANGWTVVTEDGSLAAHEEHMMLITATGCEVLARE